MNRPIQQPAGLPAPDPDARAHSDEVARHLAQAIDQAGGFLPFDQWMHLALYAPGLGYYAAGSAKFGSDLPTGDFTTAPELTPLFGQTIARSVAQVLQLSGSQRVLEFGAGSGALAAAVIPALRQAGIEPEYLIIDVSADLRERQRQRLAPLNANVRWLDALPHAFEGCVLANEVLDAMPARMFQWAADGKLMELGVQYATNTNAGEAPDPAADDAPTAATAPQNAQEKATAPHFTWAMRPAPDDLRAHVATRMPVLPGYRSEINLQAEAWIRQMGHWLRRGAALLVDYGFPRSEYYHPQRAEGTLMCHYRHQTHAQPLILPGLQDITAHVDFTAMADAALEGGLEVLGYCSQARYLLNAGLPELLLPAKNTAATAPMAAAEHASTMNAVQKLISEAEMGELFKVLAIGRDIGGPLTGFQRGDRRDRL